MRWRIESKTTESGDTRKTEIVQTQYITIGDIVGKGKSAAGAVKDLANNLPKAIHDGVYNDYGGNQTLNVVNSIVQPLAVIIQGMEAFRTMMGIIDIMTPIMKTIARTTGIWCSPGNIAELVQIGLGTAQQILIAVITSAILNLKELIWNYEIIIKKMTTELSEKIVDLLKKYNDKHKDDRPSNNPIEEIENEKNSDIESGEGGYDFEEDDPVENAIDDLIDKSYPKEDEDVGLDLEDALDFLETGTSNKRKNDLEKLSDYRTKFSVNNTVRMLRGSLSNEGIYYSDDDGKTWNKTNQIEHSFNRFAKIPTKDGYRYLAGSTHTVEEIISTEDDKFERDIYGCYSKDYYDYKKVKYSKVEKDEFEKEGFDKIKSKLYNRKLDDAVGIYYSDNNGIDWIPSNIKDGSFELFFEFEPKYDFDDVTVIPNRVVASSYDYKGIRYSDNGIDWTPSILNPSGREILTGRWVSFSAFDNELDTFFKIDDFDSYYIYGTDSGDLIKLNSLEDFKVDFSDFSVTMDSKMIQGLRRINLDNIELIKGIIKYLHDHFPKKIPHLSHDRWYSLILDINDGTYTMENAKLGERLEPDWDNIKDQPL